VIVNNIRKGTVVGEKGTMQQCMEFLQPRTTSGAEETDEGDDDETDKDDETKTPNPTVRTSNFNFPQIYKL
jgi:hypothetical protein